MKSWLPISLLLILGLACAGPKTNYYWGSYENSLYALMKNPSGLDAYGKSLKEIIDHHPEVTKLPPGIHAEYGYVLLATNHKNEAKAYFTKEKTLWPESAKIMDRMISNCMLEAK